MTGQAGGDVFRCAGGDDLAAAGTAFWSEIDDPVGGLDDVEVMLDDHDGVALIGQAVQDL